MSYLKKFAWYGSAVGLAAMLAVALFVTMPARQASAAEDDATCTTMAFVAPIQAAGLTETWTITCTFVDADVNDPIGASDVVTVEFPTSFTIAASPTATMTDGTNALTVTAATTGSAVALTVDSGEAETVANTETLTITIQVTNPSAGTFTSAATPTSTAGFSVAFAEFAAEEVNDDANEIIWNVAIADSPTSIPADGASTVGLTFTASANAANGAGGGTITITTDLGTFISSDDPGDGSIQAADGTLSTDGTTITSSVEDDIGTTADTATLRAGTTTGTATITYRVTPAGGGAAVTLDTETVTFTAPTGTTVTSVSFTEGLEELTLGGSDTATATVSGASGNIGGATVTFTVSGPASVATNGTGTCQTAVANLRTTCTITTGAGGTADVTVQSSGATGTVSLSAAAGDVSATATQSVAGPATAIAISSVGTPNVGPSGSSRVSATLTDASGILVPGSSVTFSASGISGVLVDAPTTTTDTDCNDADSSEVVTTGSTGSATGVATVLVCLPSTATAGQTVTVTATRVEGSTTLTANTTLTVGGDPATLTVVPTETSVAANGTTTVTFTVLDADGNPARSDTVLDVAVTDGVLAGCSPAGTAVSGTGTKTCTFVASGTAQTVTISAVATRGTTSVAQTAQIAVGGAVTPPPTEGEGTFDRPIPNTGVNTAVWNGGTVAQLSAGTAAAGGISVTVFVDGQATVLIPGAPAFVNAAFNAAFPTGEVPAGTIVLVVR